ncbi:hypothetical protein DPMN_091029 [Dreissena polymorpha]|uniref:Uncharacterized protein n=1 Tax=Dreissena polymorpha TaxID=45954 RepID=A0A9D4KZR5_DREPO|nr:hypothetical protein DPMN_091029 [Dreissena polymorpha]
MVNIQTKQDNASSEVSGTNDQKLQVAGKALDNLLSAPADKEISTHGDTSFMDPRTILTIKSVYHKATHITYNFSLKRPNAAAGIRAKRKWRPGGNSCPQSIRGPPVPRYLHRRMGGAPTCDSFTIVSAPVR